MWLTCWVPAPNLTVNIAAKAGEEGINSVNVVRKTWHQLGIEIATTLLAQALGMDPESANPTAD